MFFFLRFVGSLIVTAVARNLFYTYRWANSLINAWLPCILCTHHIWEYMFWWGTSNRAYYVFFWGFHVLIAYRWRPNKNGGREIYGCRNESRVHCIYINVVSRVKCIWPTRCGYWCVDAELNGCAGLITLSRNWKRIELTTTIANFGWICL